MEDIKIIALDMDGVVNSRAHVNAWIKEHFLSAADETAPDYAEARKEARKAFREEFNHSKELVSAVTISFLGASTIIKSGTLAGSFSTGDLSALITYGIQIGR